MNGLTKYCINKVTKIRKFYLHLKLGQHPRELNPYWKKGGSGVPSERTTENGNTALWFYVVKN